MSFRPTVLQFELVKDPLGVSITLPRVPLRAQPRVDLVEAVVGVEDATHHELRRHRSVPVILLKAEGNVVTALTPVAVELGPLPERDRTVLGGGNRPDSGWPRTAERPEERRAGTECTIKGERRDRASGAFPEAVRPGDENHRAVIAHHET